MATILGEGAAGKVWEEIFNWNRIKSVIIEETIVMNHVDVSSCGISLWRLLVSNFNLKG